MKGQTNNYKLNHNKKNFKSKENNKKKSHKNIQIKTKQNLLWSEKH